MADVEHVCCSPETYLAQQALQLHLLPGREQQDLVGDSYLGLLSKPCLEGLEGGKGAGIRLESIA